MTNSLFSVKPRPLMLAVVALLCLLSALAASFLVGSGVDGMIAEAKIEVAREAKISVREDFEHETECVGSIVRDWSVWDEMHDAVKKWQDSGDFDEDFIKRNMPDGWSKDVNIDCFAIVTSDGKIARDVPVGSSSRLPVLDLAKKPRRGYVVIDGKIYSVVSEQIMSTDRSRKLGVVVAMSRIISQHVSGRYAIRAKESKESSATDGSEDRVVLGADVRSEILLPACKDGHVVVVSVYPKREVMSNARDSKTIIQLVIAVLFIILYIAIVACMHTIKATGTLSFRFTEDAIT